ncbi:hypothetical protein EDC22_11636 [Tepidamorphus gemmatus]|uniref:DUF5330 domain-containing protein n=1 Tax=Tepidamorphus gemmatus TaxID=747076 RepID=A0A4R3LU84_9HYPH|nr:DUF5330 domain-containing protein [Tepidamorphus gemmatus]TCT04160.1 hypothetical protein EDC22_11636 [Tepidamorphus gemmatus]
MFLIRTAFWLTLVILLIPVSGHDGSSGEAAGPEISPVDAFEAARHTVSDLAGFCDRNPDTCRTGSAVVRVLGQKAQAGALMVYEYLAEASEDGSGRQDVRHAVDTLSLEDRHVPWRGPGGES